MILWIRELLRQLQYRMNRSRFDRDLADEMQLHVDLRAANHKAEGMPATDAQYAAYRQFGNLAHLQETSREAWGWRLLDTLRQDVRYGLRALAQQPAFTATAVISLALGIGANTAIFSIINTVMLRALPIEDPKAMVQLTLGAKGDDELNTPLWEQIRDHQRAFSGVLAYASDRFNLSDSGERRYAQGLWVSGDFFRVLGVPAVMGRAFTPADDQWGCGSSGPVAVVSHNFWQTQLSGAAGVVGSTIRVERKSFVVVGVTPPWFTGLDVERRYDIAIPIGCQSFLRTGMLQADQVHQWWLRVLGRIAPGDSLPLANERMQAVAPQIFRSAFLGAQKDRLSEFFLRPAGLGFSQTRVQYRMALLVLMAIVGLVLLIACANIANLLLARGTARQRELSLRMAIGANRSRVIRQLLTESLLLSAMGAAGGVFLAMWGSRALISLISTSRNPVEITITPDLRLLAFTTLVTAITALLFGFFPALRSTGFALNTVLRGTQREMHVSTSRFGFGHVLVTAQIVFSVIVVAAAGLFAGTFRNLLTADLGFERQNVLLMGVQLPEAASSQQRDRLFREALERVRAVPGVISAASSAMTPIAPQGWAQRTHPEGFTPKSPRDTQLFLNRVSDDYFRTMRLPIILGREFSERDTLAAQRVIIINELAARTFFGTDNPIGKTIGMDRPGRRGERDTYSVIGVAKDARYNRIDEQPRRLGYLAAAQEAQPDRSLNYVILTQTPPDSLAPSLHAAISSISRDLSLDFRTLQSQVNESLLQPRLLALLSSVFGGLALLLAMVGLYGITAYSVNRRKSEIGIRMAVGAQRQTIIWLMLKQVAVLLAVGLVLGTMAWLGVGRLLGSLLYGIKPDAPGPLVAAALILAFAAILAAYLPARRAVQLDPMQALRED